MRVGLALLLVGFVMVGGYGLYTLLRVLISADDIHFLIRFGLPVIVIGVFVILVKALWDRLRERKGPDGRNYEEAQP